MKKPNSRKNKGLAICALGAAMALSCPLPAQETSRDKPGPFETSGRAALTRETFAAATTADKSRWVSSMVADQKLDSPRNTKSIEILTWGLRDEDPAVRKAATWGARQFLENLRQKCRGTNAGKLPLPRAVLEDFGKALQPLFQDPDLIVRSDAIVSHIWLRGSAKECGEAALKLMNELSLDVTMEWGRRKTILTLMHSTGFPADQLPLDYPHPNSRKPGEPLVGTKFQALKPRKNDDNTWFDFLTNSLP